MTTATKKAAAIDRAQLKEAIRALWQIAAWFGTDDMEPQRGPGFTYPKRALNVRAAAEALLPEGWTAGDCAGLLSEVEKEEAGK